MRKSIVKVEPVKKATNRRQFLKLGGMGVVGAGLLVACSNDDNGFNFSNASLHLTTFKGHGTDLKFNKISLLIKNPSQKTY